MKHKAKVSMAKRMTRTKKEIASKTPPFQTAEWDRRKEAKLNKQLNQGKDKVKI